MRCSGQWKRPRNGAGSCEAGWHGCEGEARTRRGRFVSFVLALLSVYRWLIIVRILLSWIPLPENDIVRMVYRFIYDATEPYLGLFRRLIPSLGRKGGMGFDFSPILAIMVLYIIENLVRRTL